MFKLNEYENYEEYCKYKSKHSSIKQTVGPTTFEVKGTFIPRKKPTQRHPRKPRPPRGIRRFSGFLTHKNGSTIIRKEDFNEIILDKTNNIQDIMDKKGINNIYISTDWHLFKSECCYNKKYNIKNFINYINYFNSIVSEDDIFIYLGDISHKKCNPIQQEKTKELLQQLNGIKVLVKGNHDILSNEYYEQCGFQYIFDNELIYHDIIFSHFPYDIKNNNKIHLNIHGHLHGKKNDCYFLSNNKTNFDVYSEDKRLFKLSNIINLINRR